MHPDFVEGWHIPIIRSVVAAYGNPLYVEIGVRNGACLREIAALENCEAHGVDIVPPGGDIGQATFWHTTSDEFFQRFDGLPDVVFIDGDHSREQVAKDFANAFRLLRPTGTIFLHDTWPVDRHYLVNTGTAYRYAEQLEIGRLNTFTFRRWPGLTMVQRPQIERF